MESVLNVISSKDNNISNDTYTNLWYLGYGQTALLFRQSFLEDYLMIIDRYLKIQQSKQRLDYGIDLFVIKRGIRDRTDIVASMNNLVYHPSSQHTSSTQNHYYSKGLKCSIERKWGQGYKALQYFQTYW